jgi:hypothetical protein
MGNNAESESNTGLFAGFGDDHFQPNESPFVGDMSQPSVPFPFSHRRSLMANNESPFVGDESPLFGDQKSYQKDSDDLPSPPNQGFESLRHGLHLIFQACLAPLPEGESPDSAQPDIYFLRLFLRGLLDQLEDCNSVEERVLIGSDFARDGDNLAKMLRAQKLFDADEEIEFRTALKKIITDMNIHWCLSHPFYE